MGQARRIPEKNVKHNPAFPHKGTHSENVCRLRRRYLRLILLYPYAPESKDCDSRLWMETSYQFIATYKKRITILERVVNTGERGGQPPHGPVEHRKLIQRFRQFLAEEEKFWTKLVLRICRVFQLVEARPSLVALGLTLTAEDIGDDGGAQSNDRNQQFPVEATALPPPTSEQRPGCLAILSKALICLGDIARYREQYNESGGRPKAGHDDNVSSRRGRHRRGGSLGLDSIPRPRNYDKSQRCYEKARLILPSDGNPSHQLAILATHKCDNFLSIYHYYRSLCVLKPSDPASDNLSKVLSKALEEWKKKVKEVKQDVPAVQDPSLIAPRIRIDDFKTQIVTLLALWRFGEDKSVL